MTRAKKICYFIRLLTLILTGFSGTFLLTAQETDSPEVLQLLQKSVGENSGYSQGPLYEAVGDVQRHLYLPPGKSDAAYEDRTLPLGRGRFIPSPSDIVSLLAFSYLNTSDRVLLIGDSAGYTAALIRRITPDLTLIELDGDSIETTRGYFIPEVQDLQETAGASTLTVQPVSGLYNLLDAPLYSLIIIQASLDQIPPVLFSLLENEGRLSASLRGNSGFSILFRFDKNDTGGYVIAGKEVYFPFYRDWP